MCSNRSICMTLDQVMNVDNADEWVEKHEKIVARRARFYTRNEGKLVNSPWVDNSMKWAGGGFVSTSEVNSILHPVDFKGPSKICKWSHEWSFNSSRDSQVIVDEVNSFTFHPHLKQTEDER